MDRLSVGMHVDIMRSDGRVHGALITNLNFNISAVSVEWFEKVNIIEIFIKIFRVKQKVKKWV